MDKEPADCRVLAVPVQDPDAGPLVQELPPLEAAAVDPVGVGAKGEWEGEGSVQGPGPFRRHEVQPVSVGLPPTTDVGRRVLAPAENDAESEVSEWQLPERRE
jgi:hypothetical protein